MRVQFEGGSPTSSEIMHEMTRAARDLLRWYVDSGVDETIGTIALDRRKAPTADVPTAPAPKAIAAVPPETGKPTGAALNPDIGADQMVSHARRLAASAPTLEALREALSQFDECSLKRTAKNLVFGDGAPTSRIVFVGEAPGRDEDIQGLPFVGRSGQLLDRMLAAIGLDRTSSYITNIIPWRPPGNRNPTSEETAMCIPFLDRHLELISPIAVIALGGVSAKQLLDTTDGIMRLRGKWKQIAVGDQDVPLLPMFHPAYLLRQPAQKRLAWQDLLSLKQKLRSLDAL